MENFHIRQMVCLIPNEAIVVNVFSFYISMAKQSNSLLVEVVPVIFHVPTCLLHAVILLLYGASLHQIRRQQA